MPKILGLDIGDKYIGVALADSEGRLPHPIGAFKRAQGVAEKDILKLIKIHKIGVIVVGLPLGENNEPTEQSEKIINFCKRLQKRVSKEVSLTFVDEYGSSKESEEFLGAGEKSRQRLKKKGIIDAKSASIILERYLNGEVIHGI